MVDSARHPEKSLETTNPFTELAQYRLSADRTRVELVEGTQPCEWNPVDNEWVPAPTSPFDRNFAFIEEGSKAYASSNYWGSDLSAEEKLRNVLRLGARYGSPLFNDVNMDANFIFCMGDESSCLLVDLGCERELTRIGATHYMDRWVMSLRVESSTSWLHSPELTLQETDSHITWGEASLERPRTKTSCATFFDRQPTPVRYILIKVTDGGHYGGGARLGPVFAYGAAFKRWKPEIAHLFPAKYLNVQALVRLHSCHRALGDPGLFGRLPLSIWATIFGMTSCSDWWQGHGPGNDDKSIDAEAAGSHVSDLCAKTDTGFSKFSVYRLSIDRMSVELVEGSQVCEWACEEHMWVPAPAHPFDKHFALLQEGATPHASSNYWGYDLSAEEKLRNVLRLGARFGSPLFDDWDPGFIFDMGEVKSRLLVDLGCERELTRVGTTHYLERWIVWLQIESSLRRPNSPDLTLQGAEGHVIWGETKLEQLRGKTSHATFFSREPTVARYLLFTVMDGGHYGGGARLGPVFAYGNIGFHGRPKTHKLQIVDKRRAGAKTIQTSEQQRSVSLVQNIQKDHEVPNAHRRKYHCAVAFRN